MTEEKLSINYVETGLVRESELKRHTDKLLPYVAEMSDIRKEKHYEKPESSINLSFDTKQISTVSKLTAKLHSPNLKYIIVIGIGGSSLGSQAIYDAMRGKMDGLMDSVWPKLIFADTVSDKQMAQIEEIIENCSDKNELVINVISKSGSTMETVANLEAIYSRLKTKFGDVDDRFIFTTNKGSKLSEYGVKKNIEVLEIPSAVGGRYSVFSPVGLFPLALAGFDIEKLLDGARVMAERCIESDLQVNPALVSASLIYEHYHRNDICCYNIFFFNPELESLAKWYRQLIAESLGKEKDLNGNVVHAGFDPLITIGSTDLHSLGQLYFGGLNNKFTELVYAYSPEKAEIHIPGKLEFPELIGGIMGKKVGDIMDAIYKGVKNAYLKRGMAYTETVMSGVTLYALGQYMQFKMFEIMYLAKLMNVNAFDQPQVELYKEETRKILLG
jgi:glucose-6-phosphate isomerase